MRRYKLFPDTTGVMVEIKVSSKLPLRCPETVRVPVTMPPASPATYSLWFSFINGWARCTYLPAYRYFAPLCAITQNLVVNFLCQMVFYLCALTPRFFNRTESLPQRSLDYLNIIVLCFLVCESHFVVLDNLAVHQLQRTYVSSSNRKLPETRSYTFCI